MKIIVIRQSLFAFGLILFASAILMIINGFNNSQTVIQLNFFLVALLQITVGGWLIFFSKALQSFTDVGVNQ
jgi:hypothetical protein